MRANRSMLIPALAFLALAAAPATAQYPFLVINELDADTPAPPAAATNDDLEFIEIYDGGIGNLPLTGYSLVFFNGGAGTGTLSYFALDLTGSTDANGYYVVGNPLIAGAAQTWPPNTLQNGSDAVGLYFGPAAAFPNNTGVTAPVLATTLVDAVVYHTSDAPATGLIAALTPGQPQVNENANNISATESIGRCPNGLGGPFTTNGWLTFSPTPGGPNACPTGPIFGISITQNPPCGGPIIIQVSGATPGAEIFNLISLQCSAPAGSGGLFGLSFGPGSGDPLSQLFLPINFPPFHVNADSGGSYNLGIPTSGICPGVSLSVEAVTIAVTGTTINGVTPTSGCVPLNL